VKVSIAALVEFRLPPESFPVTPSRQSRRGGYATPLVGFCSLQHMPDSGVHSSRVCLARLVPPSGFGYPLDGLLPPGPGQPCFMPTALLGFRPSELSPHRRVSRTSPSEMNPRAVSLTAAPADESASRPGQRRLLGFDLSGSPSSSPTWLASTMTGCSPGLWSFPGHSTGRLVHTPV
jgi:hypothetical protein